MTVGRARSRITALLVCCTAGVSFASLQFSRSVLVGTLQRGGLEDAALSRLAVFALVITRPAVLASILIAFIATVATSEIAVMSRDARLLVQIGVLLLHVLLLSVVVAGLLIPFHIPDVRIP